MDAGINQLLELHGNKALLAVTAVIGHNVEVVAGGLELVLQNHNVLRAEAGDHVHLQPLSMAGLGLGIGDGATHASAHHADTLCPLGQLCGQPQRTDKVPDGVAFVQLGQQLGGQPHLLENNSDRPLLAVIVRDGQRNALALLVQAQDDELPRLRLLRDQRRLHLQQGNAGVEYFFMYDFYHVTSTSSSLRSDLTY